MTERNPAIEVNHALPDALRSMRCSFFIILKIEGSGKRAKSGEYRTSLLKCRFFSCPFFFSSVVFDLILSCCEFMRSLHSLLDRFLLLLFLVLVLLSSLCPVCVCYCHLTISFLLPLLSSSFIANQA